MVRGGIRDEKQARKGQIEVEYSNKIIEIDVEIKQQ
jgi:hypothetical protein